ncbi:MAG: hypothetical protein NTY39_12315 [Campylobacterales bacterium]|nr:hypothetical protein [Campylobacterales bacterium]
MIKKMVQCYKAFYEENAKILTKEELGTYASDAKAKNVEWVI